MSGVVIGFGFSQDTGDRMSIAGDVYELGAEHVWLADLDEGRLDSVRQLVACGFRRGVEVAEQAQAIALDACLVAAEAVS